MYYTLLILTLLTLIFGTLNLLLNSKWKYWELLTLLPVIVPIFFCVVLAISNFWHGNHIFSLINISNIILFIPFLDFGFKINKTNNNSGNKIKIIDLNTLFFYPSNPKEIADFLSAENPEIIIIQELFKTNHTNDAEGMKDSIPTKFLEPDGYLDSDFLKPLFPSYKNIITAKDKGIISNYSMELYLEHETNDKFGFICVKINLSEADELYIFNVHMPFKFDRTFGYDERREAFNHLYKSADDLITQKKKILITGDFNQSKNSKFILNLFNKLSETISENNNGYLWSWHPKLPLWRLDYMFYNMSKNYICSKSSLFKNKFSDHKGIRSEFIIQ